MDRLELDTSDKRLRYSLGGEDEVLIVDGEYAAAVMSS